jgi:hypothetical protein
LKRIKFSEIKITESDIIFMQYEMVNKDTPDGQLYDMRLKDVKGTTHKDLMMSSLFKQPPHKEEFFDRIIKKYRKGKKLLLKSDKI